MSKDEVQSKSMLFRKAVQQTGRPPEKSFKVEVLVQGKFSGNQIRLPDREQAIGYAKNLMDRWFLVEDFAVLESSDPVNYGWDGEKLVAPMEVNSESI